MMMHSIIPPPSIHAPADRCLTPMEGMEKCPRSANSASAPVMHSMTPPSMRQPLVPWLMNQTAIQCGLMPWRTVEPYRLRL